MYIKNSFPFATMGDVHLYAHSHTYTRIITPHIHTILEGKDMPYVVTCSFVILQLQPADKDEMLGIADNTQVKKPEHPEHFVYQKLVISWYEFILLNICYTMDKNLRYWLLKD